MSVSQIRVTLYPELWEAETEGSYVPSPAWTI